MIPQAAAARARAAGNCALKGAALLLDPARREEAARLAALAREVQLGGNQVFAERFVEHMCF
jgi:uncharacterized 2Fe-2S/4Fe-4S cluster protein (DUF4445 family)